MLKHVTHHATCEIIVENIKVANILHICAMPSPKQCQPLPKVPIKATCHFHYTKVCIWRHLPFGINASLSFYIYNV